MPVTTSTWLTVITPVGQIVLIVKPNDCKPATVVFAAGASATEKPSKLVSGIFQMINASKVIVATFDLLP